MCECREICADNPVPLPESRECLRDLASIGVPGAAEKLAILPNRALSRSNRLERLVRPFFSPPPPMVKFPYSPSYDRYFDTLTVGELIAKLTQFDPALPIGKTWEGQVLPMVEDDVTLSVIRRHDSLADPGMPYVKLNAE